MAQIPGSLASLFGLGDPEDLLKLAAGQLPLSTSPVTSARPASSAAPNPSAVSPEAAGAGQFPSGRVLATLPRTGAGPAAAPGVTPDMAKALQPRSSDTLGGALHAGMQSHKPEYGPWGNLLAGMASGMAYGDLAAAKDQERALETYKMMFEMQDRSAARQEALRQHELENARWNATFGETQKQRAQQQSNWEAEQANLKEYRESMGPESKIGQTAAARRKIVAEQGGDPKDPKWNEFILTGSMPSNDIEKTNRQREAEADRLGLQGDDRLKYITEGKAFSKSDEKMTSEQAKSALYSERALEAHKIASDPEIYKSALGKSGAARRSVEGIPVVGNYLAGSGDEGEAYLKYEQARRDFINAVLRPESGAAISPSEFANAEKQYFPQPNDPPSVIEQKERARLTEIQGIAMGGAPSFKKDFAAKLKNLRADKNAPDGGVSVLSEARDAIARGAPRDAVLKRLRERHPDVDVNGL